MVYGLLAVWTTMGWTYITLILSHCILLYSISLVKIRWLCFVTGLCTLATFKCEPFVSWQVNCCHLTEVTPQKLWILVGLSHKTRRYLCESKCPNFPQLFHAAFSLFLLHVGRFCGGGLWPASCSLLWRLWVYYNALHELCSGELREERWKLQHPGAAQVQLLPPLLLFRAHHDLW